jgi:hypothetical protein
MKYNKKIKIKPKLGKKFLVMWEGLTKNGAKKTKK